MFSRNKIRTTGVLHLGANTGQEAEMYASLGVRQVIWVEALPDVHAKLVEHIKPYAGQLALCACLGDIDGNQVTFRRANNESQSSSYLEFGTHAKEHPTTKFVEEISMRTVRLDTLLREKNIQIGDGWFLNVDLQGAELLALKGMGSLLRQFDWAYVEVNIRELYKGCPLVDEVDQYLGTYDFIGVETKMMKQGWGDRLYKKFHV